MLFLLTLFLLADGCIAECYPCDLAAALVRGSDVSRDHHAGGTNNDHDMNLDDNYDAITDVTSISIVDRPGVKADSTVLQLQPGHRPATSI